METNGYTQEITLSLLQKSDLPNEVKEKKADTKEEEPDFTRIRCPLCSWQPKPSSRWYCISSGHPEYFSNGCGTGWNTFETRGLCPGCYHQWRWTACLFCAGWSLHEDWYVKDSPS